MAVIGNGPQADCLTRLLQVQQHTVVQFCSRDVAVTEQPYYPNDLTSGIMRKYLQDVGISLKSCKRIESICLQEAEIRLQFPASFQAFVETLMTQFPEECAVLKAFFADIRAIGSEWAAYISSGFANATAMQLSARLYNLTLEKAFEKYELKNPVLRNVFRRILPKPGVMFTGFCGYLYTQFFDINCVQADARSLLSNPQKELVSDLRALCVDCKDEDGTFDAVVDFRIAHDLPRPQGTVLLGSFVAVNCCLRPETEYLIGLSKNDTLRVWNDWTLQMDGSKERWHFEFITAHPLPEAPKQWIAEKIQALTEGELCSFHVSDWQAVDLQYDTDHADGYRWAFDQKHSMQDPINLVRMHKSNVLQSCAWGFAWFSAAYHAANVVNYQMQCDQSRYQIR